MCGTGQCDELAPCAKTNSDHKVQGWEALYPKETALCFGEHMPFLPQVHPHNLRRCRPVDCPPPAHQVPPPRVCCDEGIPGRGGGALPPPLDRPEGEKCRKETPPAVFIDARSFTPDFSCVSQAAIMYARWTAQAALPMTVFPGLIFFVHSLEKLFLMAF